MSSKHIVRSYDEELALLKASVLEMGKSVPPAVESCVGDRYFP